MGFLLALLSAIGPLPISSKQDTNIHTWDLMNLFLLPCWKKYLWKDETEQRNRPVVVPNDVDAEGNINNSVEGSDTNDLLEEEEEEEEEEEAENEDDHDEWNIQNAAEC